MPHRFLQANVNHSAVAQHLLWHNMAEWDIDIAVVAEPYRVPPGPLWMGDVEGRVAIVGKSGPGAHPLSLLERGRGFVAALWGETVVVGGYFSPSRTRRDFEQYLEEVAGPVRRAAPRQVILAGDLNAKAVAWGSPVENARGRVLEDWAVEEGLLVLNQGNAPTCVRHNGESVIDVSFGSPTVARRVKKWRVLEGEETLSDHLYIRWEVSDPSIRTQRVDRSVHGPPPRRWVIKKMDADLLMAAAMAVSWGDEGDHPAPRDVEGEVNRLREELWQICDAAMPRSRPPPKVRSAYWWTPLLTTLRKECNRVRRQLKRHRRRARRDRAAEGALHQELMMKRSALKNAI